MSCPKDISRARGFCGVRRRTSSTSMPSRRSSRCSHHARRSSGRTIEWPASTSISGGWRTRVLRTSGHSDRIRELEPGTSRYFYIYSGDFVRADEAAEAWYRERPANVTALLTRIITALLSGRLELAEERLASASRQSARRALGRGSRGDPACAARPLRSCSSVCRPCGGFSTFVRPHPPRPPSRGLRVRAARGCGQGHGVARARGGRGIPVLAVLPDRSLSGEPARSTRFHPADG